MQMPSKVLFLDQNFVEDFKLITQEPHFTAKEEESTKEKTIRQKKAFKQEEAAKEKTVKEKEAVKEKAVPKED